MKEQRVSLRYARALFDTAKSANNIEDVYKDFMLIDKYIENSKELTIVLRSPIIQNWKKKKLLKELFSENVSKLTFNFLMLITEKERVNFLSDIIDYFDRLYLADKNIIKADITTAHEIDEILKNKIVSEFEKKLSKKIIPSFKTNPYVVGGIMIKIEDWIYDASVRNQLNQLKNRLIEGNLV